MGRVLRPAADVGETHPAPQEDDVGLDGQRFVEPAGVGARGDEADDAADIPARPLVMRAFQPAQRFAERRIDEGEPARPVVDEPVAAFFEQDAALRDHRAQLMTARVKVDRAERMVDLRQELWRGEADVTVGLVAFALMSALHGAAPGFRRQHGQQAEQAGNRPAAALEAGKRRARYPRA